MSGLNASLSYRIADAALNLTLGPSTVRLDIKKQSLVDLREWLLRAIDAENIAVLPDAPEPQQTSRTRAPGFNPSHVTEAPAMAEDPLRSTATR